MTTQSDARFMAVALTLGRRGMGRVWPNPAVGCVIVRDGRIVGRGWTADGGRPHAETHALVQAGALAKGATAYVTLEPCSHHAKTPPCAQALIDAGIACVVVATDDPDARVAGRGIAMLRDAGIEVRVGVLADQARTDHAGFLTRITENRPFVTLKLAGSLDGRIATATGESQWITGPDARRAVHMMRARHDAVMVGAGTVRADDPSLTVRGVGIARQPVRVVVAGARPLSVDCELGKTAGDVPVWVCHGPQVDISGWTGVGAQALACSTQNDQVDPVAAMRALADKGITRVFCEGGGMLAASLLRAGMVDQLVAFTAGAAIGGDGTAMLGGLGITELSSAPRFKLKSAQQVGGDICHTWVRLPAP